jgi:hypothetical protein
VLTRIYRNADTPSCFSHINAVALDFQPGSARRRGNCYRDLGELAKERAGPVAGHASTIRLVCL